MDKLTEETINNETEGVHNSFFDRLSRSFDTEKIERAKNKRALIYDLLFFTVGFIFSRCHLLFGAYPVGIAFVAMLPIGVWSALIGGVIGSLSMGFDGVIFAAVSAVVVFLRAALSSSGKTKETALFHESLLLRMSVATLGGFIAAAYNVLLSGLSEGAMLFGLSMIILPPTLAFVFSGVLGTSVTDDAILSSSEDIFSLSRKDEHEKYNLIFFQISALMIIFFISLSLGGVNIFGISASYIFTTMVTLFVAKRFGALRALATGFVTSLGVSGIYSVSFALMGLGAGLMFSFGAGYAIITGGIALSAWSIYASGLTGFLTTFPEYVIAATLSLPLLKKISEIRAPEETIDVGKSAEEMVGTMALAYQNKYSGSLDLLVAALSELSGVIRNYSSRPSSLTKADYVVIITDIAEKLCKECSSSELCTNQKIEPCIKNAETIAEKLLRGESISAEDVNTNTEFCQIAAVVAEAINRESARAEQEIYKLRDSDTSADEYELISKLINGARLSDDAERAVDNSMTEALTEAVESSGFEDSIIRVFGERNRHLFLAGEDESGKKITSAELRENIEKAMGVKLATPEYYKNGRMALMECGIRRSYSVSLATASMPGDEKEISGDTAAAFETSGNFFYSLLSDGMGSGDIAKETSEFVAKFLRCALEIGTSRETVMHMLNHTIRTRTDECSATVDLFELDLLNGEATFIKSGAAPSYVKRDSSIFRIRSQTAPIGLMRSIDTEKIRVEVRGGDHIIMLSDGVSQSTEDAPWLLELLSEPPIKNLKEYANEILKSAAKNSKSGDDMSVIVLRIDQVE